MRSMLLLPTLNNEWQKDKYNNDIMLQNFRVLSVQTEWTLKCSVTVNILKPPEIWSTFRLNFWENTTFLNNKALCSSIIWFQCFSSNSNLVQHQKNTYQCCMPNLFTEYGFSGTTRLLPSLEIITNLTDNLGETSACSPTPGQDLGEKFACSQGIRQAWR